MGGSTAPVPPTSNSGGNQVSARTSEPPSIPAEVLRSVPSLEPSPAAAKVQQLGQAPVEVLERSPKSSPRVDPFASPSKPSSRSALISRCTSSRLGNPDRPRISRNYRLLVLPSHLHGIDEGALDASRRKTAIWPILH